MLSNLKRKMAIRAKIRKFYGVPDINKLEKDIEGVCGDVVSFSAIGARKYKRWQRNLQQIVLYEKCVSCGHILLGSSSEVTYFITALHMANRILKSPDTPGPVKEIIEDFFRRRLRVMAIWWGDNCYTRKLFALKEKFPKNCSFVSAFIECMLDFEVYRLFYEKIYNKMTYEERHKYEKYTPEAEKEWNGYYNRLCKKYDLAEYMR